MNTADLLPMPPRLRNLIATADAGPYPADVNVTDSVVRFPLDSDGTCYVLVHVYRGTQLTCTVCTIGVYPGTRISFRDARSRVVQAR